MTEERPDGLWIEELLTALDNDPPRVTAEDVMRRASEDGKGGWRWVAGIVAALAVGGAVYALPGSPVRTWLRALDEPTAEVTPQPGEAPLPPIERGGVVLPADVPLDVEIAEGSAGLVRISVADSGGVVARVLAGEPRFTSDPGRLTMAMAPPDTLEVIVPRAAAVVVLWVGGVEVFRASAVRGIETFLARDPSGDWLLVLPGPR